VQARLPLLYRRMFGRAALETRDLVRGREAEMTSLDASFRRWAAGLPGAVAIIGEPRSGRTTLANVWTRGIAEGRPVFRIAAAGGDSGVHELNASVAQAVGAREGRSAEGALRSVAPGAIVVLDELGPWIERSPEGLSALKAWTRLFRRLGDRHFFVVTATPWSFAFGDQVAELSHAFLGIVGVRPMSGAALDELLLLRQRTSDFEVDFGPAAGFGRKRSGVRRHLGLLRQRSQGNVGEAVDLWRRSVIDVTERRIRIDVRPAPDLGVLEPLPDGWKVALAGIALHRSLSVAKMARVFRVPREEASSVLQDLSRAVLVQERSGAWELDPLLQSAVVRMLRRGGLLS